MKNREQLHRFIKKLDKSEKRAFKLYVSKYETVKDKKLIQLFNLINKMDEFDESKLLKVSAKGTLNYDLHRLRHSLLNAMSDLNFKNEGDNLGEIINRMELGFKYEMPSIIEAELAKGYKLANAEKNDFITLILAKYEHRFCFVQKDMNRFIDTDIKILNYNEQAQLDISYDLMVREVQLWYAENYQKETVRPLVFSRPEIKEIFNGPIEDKSSIRHSKAFYTAKSLYLDIIEDVELKLEIRKAIFDLFVKHEIDPQIDHTVCYSFSNLELEYLRSNKLNEAKVLLDFFKENYLVGCDLKSPNIIEISYYESFVKLMFYEKKYVEIISLLPVYEKYLNPSKKEFNNYLGDYKLREFRLNIIATYFHLKEYEECLNWIALNEIESERNSVNDQVDLHMKFIQTLSYYELGYEKLVSSSLNKIYYFLNKEGNENSMSIRYFESLQVIVKGRSTRHDWEDLFSTGHERVFGIGGVLLEYLENKLLHEE